MSNDDIISRLRKAASPVVEKDINNSKKAAKKPKKSQEWEEHWQLYKQLMTDKYPKISIAVKPFPGEIKDLALLIEGYSQAKIFDLIKWVFDNWEILKQDPPGVWQYMSPAPTLLAICNRSNNIRWLQQCDLAAES